MFYREAGDFKASYVEDSQTFPIKFDRYRYYAVLVLAFGVIPFLVNDYWVNAILLPFLIYAIAAIGLNILVGYCGQVSLGTGGFMAVGAYACYKLMTAFPEVSMFIHVLLAGPEISSSEAPPVNHFVRFLHFATFCPNLSGTLPVGKVSG